MRARELGVVLGGGTPGPKNAITDVPGVRVGLTTIIEGDGKLVVGRGPIRTGVTVVLAHPGDVWREPVFAGCHRLNGNGELTGLEWIRESGQLMSPIALTNTHSVGVVRDAIVAAATRDRPGGDSFWVLPVVGETWDGLLNDTNGMHVQAEHVLSALDGASDDQVSEGGVGSGTGMVCHGFKGGLGTASRCIVVADQEYTVGVLVQANHGRRERLSIDGVPVGLEIPSSEIPLPMAPSSPDGAGSIIVVVATDAPLLPHQLRRVAQRPTIAIGRMGGTGEQWSGDLFIAFSTGNRLRLPNTSSARRTLPLTMLSDGDIDQVFDATIEATEEAILNCLVAAEDMVGRDGVTAYRLPHDRLLRIMEAYNRPTTSMADADPVPSPR
jgi:D-aminopeptidase